MPATDEQIERLESAANTLRGVVMHLGIVAGKNRGVGLQEPIEAIKGCITKIDSVTDCAGTPPEGSDV